MRLSFNSGGRPIPVDVFRPRGAGRHPVVLALHGSAGFMHLDPSTFAQMLADRGFAIFVPHFFEATGTGYATENTIRQHFPAWMRVISHCLDYAESQEFVQPGTAGLIGFSLGAYLALSLGSQQERVRAVVDFFGGMPEHFAERIQHSPAVLILHGDRDLRVPVSEAYHLEQLLKNRSIEHEMKIYKGAGHGLSGFDMMDAGMRTYSFLKRHLLDRRRQYGT